MEFMLCLTTEVKNSQKIGGSNITSDGVDWTPYLLFYSVGNGTRRGKTIHQDPSWIVVSANVCEVYGGKFRFCRTTKERYFERTIQLYDGGIYG